MKKQIFSLVMMFSILTPALSAKLNEAAFAATAAKTGGAIRVGAAAAKGNVAADAGGRVRLYGRDAKGNEVALEVDDFGGLLADFAEALGTVEAGEATKIKAAAAVVAAKAARASSQGGQ